MPRSKPSLKLFQAAIIVGALASWTTAAESKPMMMGNDMPMCMKNMGSGDMSCCEGMKGMESNDMSCCKGMADDSRRLGQPQMMQDKEDMMQKCMGMMGDKGMRSAPAAPQPRSKKAVNHAKHHPVTTN